MRQWLCSSLLAVLVTAFSIAARADDAEHLDGLELMLRPAVGSGGATSPVRYAPQPGVTLSVDPGALLEGDSPYGVGFVGQAFLGYRFHPVISAGLRGGLRSSSADDLDDDSKEVARKAWDAGFYLRGYALAWHEGLRRHLDPWLAVGITYMRDTQTFVRPVPTSLGSSVPADWKLDHHAIAVPLSVGIDYRVLSMLSLGPSFEYTIATGKAACVEVAASGFVTNEYCTDKSPGKEFLEARTYGVWSVGLDVKLTLF
jgi:hypothetical protein